MSNISHVVISIELPGAPLVRACGIFTTAIASFDFTILVFIHFSSNMVIVKRFLWRHLRNNVFIVSNTPLVRHFLLRKGSITTVTDSGLSEVNHGNANTVLFEHHTSELSKSCSKTVTSCLNRVVRMSALKSLDFL